MQAVKGWLRIRYGDRDFSQWLPIGRYQDRFGSRERRASVMLVIKGFIAAIETVKPRMGLFRRRCPRNKNVLLNQPFRGRIHILLQAVQSAFTWPRQARILAATARD
jgi:hypothetical protein